MKCKDAPVPKMLQGFIMIAVCASLIDNGVFLFVSLLPVTSKIRQGWGKKEDIKATDRTRKICKTVLLAEALKNSQDQTHRNAFKGLLFKLIF